MNIIEKIKNWFNRYEGASFSVDRSYLSGAIQDARLDVSKASRSEIMRRARYHEKNDGIVNKLADVWELYTVGSGINFIPASKDEAWNLRAADAWNGWQKYADLSTLQGFGSLQSVIARAVFIDGEIFVLLTRGESARPRIQLIEAHRCGTPEQHQSSEGISIFDGIETDTNGRAIAYWFETIQGTGKVRRRELAENVVHIFEPSRAGQMRGLSYLYPVINDVTDLSDLAILEMRAAKEAAERVWFVKNATGEADKSMLRRSRYTTQSTNVSGDPVTQGRSQYFADGTGGKTIYGRIGEELQEFLSNRPTVTQQWYWKYLEERICIGTGINYVLVRPESMQGTTYRGALDSQAAFFKAKSAMLAAHFQRIYEYVISIELGNLRRPADWFATEYRAPKAVNVDVGRNSNAVISELAAGLRDWDSIGLELGVNGREILRRKAATLKYIKELSAEYGVDEAQIAASGLPQPEKAQNDLQQNTME